MHVASELFERIARHAAAATNRFAYVEAASGRSITYRDLFDRARSLAARIESEVRGNVVILRCGNRIEFPIWFVALLRAGASVFPVSTELADVELRDIAKRANVRAIVGETWPIELAVDSIKTSAAFNSSSGDMLLASSGTTGVPKIARRSGESLDAVSCNMVEAIGIGEMDSILAAVPLTHSYGIEHGLLAPMWAGCTVRLVDGFDLPVIARELREGNVNVFPAVPSMIEMLAGLTDDSLAMPSLRLAYSAGGPLPRAVYDRFVERFHVRVGQLYGMTEIGSVTFNAPDVQAYDPSSVGQPMQDVSIRILSLDHARRDVTKMGEEGEVIVRAPSMFSEYIGDETPLIDSHFPTGDVGRIDAHGNLSLTGRVRLLIDTGGVKVNPLEVESVIGMHPDVLECVVVPMRQSETIARLRAFVVLRNGIAPPNTSESIRAFARERLASYKVPRIVEFRTTLPRTAAGKVQRHLLEM